MNEQKTVSEPQAEKTGAGHAEVGSTAGSVRIFLHPGHVQSEYDLQRHYISADKLAHLYNVRLRDCIVVRREDLSSSRGYVHRESDIHLYPRRDGKYVPPNAGLCLPQTREKGKDEN